MPKHTLYAYVDGNDVRRIAAQLERDLDAFVASRTWSRRTWVVNQKHPPDPSDGPDDPPDWDIGLNHELADPDVEQDDWFDEVAAIAGALGELSAKFNREFIVGLGDNETGHAEDLHEITMRDPDLPRLREILADAPPATG